MSIQKMIVGLFVFTAALMIVPFTIPILAVMVGLFILYANWICLTADKITINITDNK